MTKYKMTKFFLFLMIFSCADINLLPDSNTSGENDVSTGSINDNKAPIFPKANLFTPYSEPKKPYLVYYAVDGIEKTDEPYMYAAVEYEIYQLKKLCLGNDTKVDKKNINWIILRNSIINGKSNEAPYYELCWQGEYQKVDISHVIDQIKYEIDSVDLTSYDKTNGEYDMEGAVISDFCYESDITGENIKKNGWELVSCPRVGTYPLPHGYFTIANDIVQARKNVGFLNNSNIPIQINFQNIYKNQYPMIHPSFLEAVVKNKILHPFHPSKYIPIFHIKSHGQYDYAITGLLPHQLESKKMGQYSSLNLPLGADILASENASKLAEKELTIPVPGFVEKMQNIYNQFTKNNKITQVDNSLSLLSQDDLCGLGGGSDYGKAVNNGENLNSLAENSIHFGNHPGITPETFTQIILGGASNKQEDYTEYGKEAKESLFVFLEACDANIIADSSSLTEKDPNADRWNSMNDFTKKNIKALYTAQGSLFYRNIDWEILFQTMGLISDEKLHAKFLQFALTEISSKIPNWKHPNSIKAKGEYIKVINELRKIVGEKKLQQEEKYLNEFEKAE